jgi:uncharacterized delta-60 repeat protein
VAGFSVARFDTDGTLDATFGEDGMARADFTPDGDWANALAIQPDGKIVAAGLAGWRGWQPEVSDTLFALARFNADGTLDDTFGGDGKVTTSFAGVRPEAEGVAIQADGKIVAAGRAGGRFAVARYLGE